MTWVWTESDTVNGDLLMMLALADFADDDGTCWPSYATLARKCRVTERTAIRTIDKLVAAGHVQKMETGGGHKSNRYRIIMSNTPDADVTPDNLSRDADVTPALTPASPQTCRPRHPIHQQPSTTTNDGGGSKSYVGRDDGWRDLRAAYESQFGVVPPHVWKRWRSEPVVKSIDDRESQTFIDPKTGERLEL
jgi:hypothetical protein